VQILWAIVKLTVEQVLVLFVVIQITTVLLDTRVNAKSTGVNLLNAEVIGIQFAINLTLLGTIGTRDPEALDIGATDVMVPVGGRTAGVLLGQAHHGTAGGLREVVGDVFPHLASFAREGLEVFRKVLQGLGEVL
jgi:hypothetical protein